MTARRSPGPITRRSEPPRSFGQPASTARGAQKHIRTLIEGGELAGAREALRAALHGREFETAFRSGNVQGWPVGVLPEPTAGALESVPPALRATLTPRVVTDRVRRYKLRALHREVTVATYRLLQPALDRGELLLQRARPPKEKLARLVVHAPHESGDGWWRFAVRIDPRGGRLWLATALEKSDAARRTRVEADGVTVLRAWERDRWEPAMVASPHAIA